LGSGLLLGRESRGDLTTIIVENPGADCASMEEIADEMFFFSKVLHCYGICISILWRTRTIFTVEEIAALQSAINEI
jgi:hypothetical protein